MKSAVPVSEAASFVPSQDPISLVWKRASAFVELTKPRVNFLVVLTAAAGYYMGSAHPFDFFLFVTTLVGTGLVAGGSAALNQWLERGLDARMPRTARRPLPSGRLRAGSALAFGLALIASGTLVLGVGVNALTAWLGLATAFLYVLVYTPLKTRTALCTAVGAIPGAMPPLMGWTGAQGALSPESVVLFLILLFWQFPHFLAISWAFKTDYQEGGFSMLSGADPSGRRTAIRISLYTLALVLVSFVPSVMQQTGLVYLVGVVLLSIYLLLFAVRTVIERSRKSARGLSFATIVYLPLLLVLMILDKA